MRRPAMVEILLSHAEATLELMSEYGFEEDETYGRVALGDGVIAVFGLCPFDSVEEIRDLEAVVAVTLFHQ